MRAAPTGIEQRHYQQIVGGCVTGIAWDDESFGNPVPVLLVKLPSGCILQCAVMCDPEGNGPGFLDIEESGQ